jgi:hypothetical protein
MKENIYLSMLFVAVMVIFGISCAPRKRSSALPRKASFSLNCPRKSLSYVKLGRNQYGVSGCGRRATFIYLCRGRTMWDKSCNWIKN